jgi:AmmeMemoRadiSam system protein A
MSHKTEHAIVALARQSILHYLTHGELLNAPRELPPEWHKPAGVFVSLKKKGALRGCIGTCLPTQANLACEIIQNAVSAAIADPRFPPLTLAELESLEISVDVLSHPEKVDGIEHLDPQRYGVIVRAGPCIGVLLPEIPEVTSAAQQVAIARRKAGIRPDEPIEIYRFEVTRYQ